MRKKQLLSHQLSRQLFHTLIAFLAAQPEQEYAERRERFDKAYLAHLRRVRASPFKVRLGLLGRCMVSGHPILAMLPNLDSPWMSIMWQESSKPLGYGAADLRLQDSLLSN
jgi:hypothetical protein